MKIDIPAYLGEVGYSGVYLKTSMPFTPNQVHVMIKNE